MALPKAGLKAGLKAVGQAISKPQFINIPPLGTPVNYTAWLTCLLKTPRNQHAAKRSMKSDIDELLHQQAGKQFKNNNELLQKALAETTTKASEDAWKCAQARCQGTMIEPIDDVIARLNLPRVCSGYGFTAGYNAMDFQTYGEFASQARKKNPEVLFTKEIMDTEFHAAASKVPKWAPNKRNCWLRVWRMNARCLGKESKEYWKSD